MLSEEKPAEVLEEYDLTKSLRSCRSADQRHHHTGSRDIERPTGKVRTGIVHQRLVVDHGGSKRTKRPFGRHAQGLYFCLAIQRSCRPRVSDSSIPEVGVVSIAGSGPVAAAPGGPARLQPGSDVKLVFDLLESTALYQWQAETAF